MILKIAKKEFLLNLMTFKFAVGAVACVLLTAVFMPILAADYRQRLETYNKQIADNEAELRTAKVYRNIRHTVYRPPAVLSAFSAGLEKQLAGSALQQAPTLRPRRHTVSLVSHFVENPMSNPRPWCLFAG